MKVLNTKARIFEGFASVEVRDRQGDIIPIEEIKKVFDVYVKNGGSIVLNHTNKVVGRVLDWFVAKDSKTGKEGIYIVGQIYKGFGLFDEVWEAVKKGVLGGLSFGGKAHDVELVNKDGQPTRKLKGIEAYELSLCQIPANPRAKIEAVALAKSEDYEIQKPFAGFKDWDDCMRHMKERYDEETAKKVCGKLKAKYEEKGENVYNKENEKNNIKEGENMVEEMKEENVEKKEEAKKEVVEKEEPNNIESKIDELSKKIDSIATAITKLYETLNGPKENETQNENEVVEEAIKTLQKEVESIKKAIKAKEVVAMPKEIKKAENKEEKIVDIALGKTKKSFLELVRGE